MLISTGYRKSSGAAQPERCRHAVPQMKTRRLKGCGRHRRTEPARATVTSAAFLEESGVRRPRPTFQLHRSVSAGSADTPDHNRHQIEAFAVESRPDWKRMRLPSGAEGRVRVAGPHLVVARKQCHRAVVAVDSQSCREGVAAASVLATGGSQNPGPRRRCWCRPGVTRI